MKRIYLDNNATTAVSPEVLEAMRPFLGPHPGNPSSMHREGQVARRAVESARETIAELLDAEPKQVIFTSGGTEANNLALFGQAGHPPGPLVSSTIEHPSVTGCFDELARRGFEVLPLAVDKEGIVRAAQYAALIARQPALIAIMLANNETGAIQPIAELAAEARARGIAFHTDAVQAAGKMPVSFRKLGATTLSLSAHKFHGPIGVGALIAERPPRPILFGGHQESGLRPGTEPVALIVGMAKALELAVNGLEQRTRSMRELRDLFWNRLRDQIEGLVLNGPIEPRLCNTVNLQFPGIDAQSTVLALDLLGLACSTGSACSSGAPTPSPVLLAMGLSEAQARSSIRFSLSHDTTPDQILEAVERISQVVTRRN